MKGEVWKTANKFEQALEDLGASTSLEQYGPGHRQHAVCSIRLNQLHSALDDLERSYKINPRSAVTMAYLANVEEELGKKADAEKHISDALNKSDAG